MRIIVSEEQFNKLNRSSPALQNGINKYLNRYIADGNRQIGKKSRSYGNLNETWCINGKEMISARYQFMDNKFDSGMLVVTEELVKTIQSYFSVKKSFVLHVIEEWYEDVMVPKFEKIVGESGLSINSIHVHERTQDCIPEPVKPEGITDEEMIDYIVKNTLNRKPDVIEKIESGKRDLEDYYLDIVDTVKRREMRPF
jgi:hypothetical protein